MVESIFDRVPMPPIASLLGWHVRAFDKAAKSIEVGYSIDDRFLNPSGDVQGGIVAAMLDDTVGPALFCSTDGAFYAPTIELHVSFIRPAKLGSFVGKGRVLSLGKTIVFLDGELFDAGGELVARATASGRVISGSKVS